VVLNVVHLLKDLSFREPNLFSLKPKIILSSSGVNFINVLRAALTHADHKSEKKRLDDLLDCLFCAFLGSLRVKAACKKLAKFA